MTVFDVLARLPSHISPEQECWAAEGAGDALARRVSYPDQYTSRKAQTAYRLGYRVAVAMVTKAEGL